jgi:hypothetical protein
MKFRIKIFFTVFYTLLLSLIGSAQNPNQLVQGVYQKLMQAKDYTVNANIKVDLPFIRMLPIDAKIFFKQNNKFKVESKSIAIIPRQGFDQLPKMLSDTNSYTAVITGKELIDNTETSIVNIITLSDTSDLILGKLWIDKQKLLVLKSQLTTKKNGTILTEYSYGKQIIYGLPDFMTFTVDIKKFSIPKSIAADINNAKVKDKDKDKKDKKGRIFITLNNYQINKGINDKVFDKTK